MLLDLHLIFLGYCNDLIYLSFMGTDRYIHYELFRDILRIFGNMLFCCCVYVDLLSFLKFFTIILWIEICVTFYLLLFLSVLFLLITHFLFSFFLFDLTLLWRLTKFSHLFLELFIFIFNFLLFFSVPELLFFKLLFLCLELFMYLIHFLTFLEKFCWWGYCIVLVEYRNFYLFFSCHTYPCFVSVLYK